MTPSPTERGLHRGKTIPDDGFYFTPSCILGALSPAVEVLTTRIFDQLGLRWGTGGAAHSQCTCCSGILSHGDVITPESSLLVIARIWSVAAEAGFANIATGCVTSYAMHTEALTLLDHEPGLAERVDRWLGRACGRRLVRPAHVVHASDLVYRYRAELARHFVHRLVDSRTGAPLGITDHVGCHYAKLFGEETPGGVDTCDVLTSMIRDWGGTPIDYPERSHCCGMGFRQCMIRPNRGFTVSCVEKKLSSMAPYAPKLILTNCPGCNQFLDRHQFAVNELTASQYAVPVLSYAELAGLLLGLDPYDAVGIQNKTVPVEPLLDAIGIPHEPRRAYLTQLPTERPRPRGALASFAARLMGGAR